jgi:GTP pyrophosphokinase
MDIDILGMSVKLGKDNVGTINLMLSIMNLEQMDRALSKIRGLQGVMDVYRANN